MLLRFTEDHEWLKIDGEVATVGITAYAAEQLGDLVFVQLPEIGTTLDKGQEAVVESVKAASDVYAPAAGEVVAINEEIVNDPSIVNANPESSGWFYKLKLADAKSVDGLMDRAVELEDHIRIRDIISGGSKGAIEVHDLKTRIAGRATFIEFHLVVDADMTVRDSHVICDRIEEALKAEIPSVRVLIHVEPEHEAKLPAGSAAVPFA